MREYGVRNYDAEATHKDYLIGDISHIGATRLGSVLSLTCRSQARCRVMFPDNARLRRLLPRLQTKSKLSLPSR